MTRSTQFMALIRTLIPGFATLVVGSLIAVIEAARVGVSEESGPSEFALIGALLQVVGIAWLALALLVAAWRGRRPR